MDVRSGWFKVRTANTTGREIQRKAIVTVRFPGLSGTQTRTKVITYYGPEEFADGDLRDMAEFTVLNELVEWDVDFLPDGSDLAE